MPSDQSVDANDQHEPVLGRFVLVITGVAGIAALVAGYWGMKMYPPIQCSPGIVCNVMSIKPFFLVPGMVLLTVSIFGLMHHCGGGSDVA